MKIYWEASELEKLIVHGGNPLNGTVRVSGAKNAVLPIIVASMLGVGKSTLTEIPELADVHTVSEVIKSLGVAVESPEKGTLVLDGTNITSTVAPYDLVRRMRASFLVMGPLLARKRHAKISLPGGCSIGARPIDLHLKAFEAMGAVIDLADGDIEASVPDGLKGARIYLDFPSVGVIPDRIEAGTFMVGAAMTQGNVYVENALSEHLKPLIAKLKEVGARVEEDIDGIRVIGTRPLKAVEIKTLPYPGFPTDMQAQFMALATKTVLCMLKNLNEWVRKSVLKVAVPLLKGCNTWLAVASMRRTCVPARHLFWPVSWLKAVRKSARYIT